MEELNRLGLLPEHVRFLQVVLLLEEVLQLQLAIFMLLVVYLSIMVV